MDRNAEEAIGRYFLIFLPAQALKLTGSGNCESKSFIYDKVFRLSTRQFANADFFQRKTIS